MKSLKKGLFLFFYRISSTKHNKISTEGVYTPITVKLPSGNSAVFEKKPQNLKKMTTNTSKSITSKAALFVIVFLFTAITTHATSKNEIIVPLPVSVIYQSLVATTTNTSVVLNWTTVSELNNNYFEVEKSTDMKNFKTVAVVLDGFSTEGSGKRYAFKEQAKSAKQGQVTYYRLKQFDGFGNSTYSDIMKIENSNAAN